MKRIQRRRTKGWRQPLNTIYLGRPGRWGNPFDTEWEFRKWLEGFLITGGSLERRRQRILEHERELADYTFGSCWCRPGEPCHVDVYIDRMVARGRKPR